MNGIGPGRAAFWTAAVFCRFSPATQKRQGTDALHDLADRSIALEEFANDRNPVGRAQRLDCGSLLPLFTHNSKSARGLAHSTTWRIVRALFISRLNEPIELCIFRHGHCDRIGGAGS